MAEPEPEAELAAVMHTPPGFVGNLDGEQAAALDELARENDELRRVYAALVDQIGNDPNELMGARGAKKVSKWAARLQVVPALSSTRCSARPAWT